MELETNSVAYDDYYDEEPAVDLPCPENLAAAYSHIKMDPMEAYCESMYDTALCWPPTRVGTSAQVPCPDEFYGVQLSEGIAGKLCIDNRTWAKADYEPCFQTDAELLSEEEETFSLEKTLFIGYAISSVLLLLVLLFFCIRKEDFLLRAIQMQLLVSYLATSLVFIGLHFIVMFWSRPNGDGTESSTFEMVCKLFSALMNYSTLSNFFWMFGESLYLHVLVVYPDSVQKLGGWKSAVIGWGLPAILILAFVLIKVTLNDTSCWFSVDTEYQLIELVLAIPIFLCILLMLILLGITSCKQIHSDATLALIHPDKQGTSLAVKKALTAAVPLFFWIGLLYGVNFIPRHYLPVSEHLFQWLLAIGNGTKGAVLAVVYFFFNTWVPVVILEKCTSETEEEEPSVNNDRQSPPLGTLV